MSEPITITHMNDADVPALWRLAALDDRSAPRGPALLAYVGDELRAALGIADGRAVADPFHPTADLVDLLRFQAQHEPAA